MQIQGLQELLSLKYMMEEPRPVEGAEVDSTACNGIMLRRGVGQLKHLATRTIWAQQILQQEGFEVRRTSRTVTSASCFASHNSCQDLYRTVERGLERSSTTTLEFLSVQLHSTR